MNPVATPSQWIQGARPRTLPNAIAPVVVGVGAALHSGDVTWWKSVLALAVAVAFIIGVNFANDYSDGIRGTDEDRSGPLRLTGSGLARPAAVRGAAFGAFGVAAVAGVALSVVSNPWLIAVGAVCILAAWFYTGGKRPYGYRGLGEAAVFVFFGLVAVLGTEYTQSGSISWVGLVAAITVGALSAAVNLANNIRDIPSDEAAGKRTLAVLLGERRARSLFLILLLVPIPGTAALLFATWWAALGFLGAPLLLPAAAPIVRREAGARLIPVLGATGRALLAWSALTAIGLVLAAT